MAKQTSIFQTTGINAKGTAFVNADGTTAKTLFTAGANDSLINMLAITSDDSAAEIIHLYLHDGATAFLIQTLPVAAGVGADGALNALDAIAATWLPIVNGKRVLFLKTGWTLKAAMAAAITAAKTITVLASGEDY